MLEARPAPGCNSLVVEVAIVHAADVIACVAVAPDEDSLYRALSAYLREQAPYQLARSDARRVAALLGQEAWARAVHHYFESIDGRWDPERLTRARLPLSEAAALPMNPEATRP
jgi:hypothetical protein